MVRAREGIELGRRRDRVGQRGIGLVPRSHQVIARTCVDAALKGKVIWMGEKRERLSMFGRAASVVPPHPPPYLAAPMPLAQPTPSLERDVEPRELLCFPPPVLLCCHNRPPSSRSSSLRSQTSALRKGIRLKAATATTATAIRCSPFTRSSSQPIFSYTDFSPPLSSPVL